MTEYRAIGGSRRDLTRIRGARELRRLALEGPGIASLAGLERMTALEAVKLERLHEPDVRPLRALPALRRLEIEQPSGGVDWRVLEDLESLEYLFVSTGDGAALASLDLSALRRLEIVALMAGATFELAWLPALPALRQLHLGGGAKVSDAAVQRICDAGERWTLVALRCVTPEQGRRLRSSVAPGALDIESGPRPFDRIVEAAPGVYSLGVDVASAWGLETSLDAEAAFERELSARHPEIARRVSYDNESAALWISSVRRDDLVAIQRMVSELSGTG